MTEVYKQQRIGTREDYAALADLAERFAVEFTVLAERFEVKKLSIDTIRRRLERAVRPARKTERAIVLPDEDWLTTEQAEMIVPGLSAAAAVTRISPRRKLRDAMAKGARGVGYLWHRGDLIEIRRIREHCRISARAALIAWNRLHMPLPASDEWFTTQEARRLVPGLFKASKLIRGAVDRKPGKGSGVTRGWLWLKRDVLMAQRLTASGGVRTAVALRILAARKQRRI